jgi:hypothetical protein
MQALLGHFKKLIGLPVISLQIGASLWAWLMMSMVNPSGIRTYGLIGQNLPLQDRENCSPNQVSMLSCEDMGWASRVCTGKGFIS